jgi:thymidylate synthase
MQSYLKLLSTLLEHGEKRPDRTGVGTLSLFVYTMDFDLKQGLPLVTTKKLHLKSVIRELLWMISGDTNAHTLAKQGVSIWNEWADADGSLGPIYGAQWRAFGATKNGNGLQKSDGNPFEGVDQLSQLISQLKKDPFSRRHIVSAWNPVDLPQMKLPPCHCFFQFYVSAQRELSCHLLQRSGDVFLGIPFNIAFYSIFTHMVAQVCDFKVGRLVHTINDAHLYLNHVEQAQAQLQREPLPLPTLKLNPNVTDLFQFQFDDIEILNYQSHPAISAPVAV